MSSNTENSLANTEVRVWENADESTIDNLMLQAIKSNAVNAESEAEEL